MASSLLLNSSFYPCYAPLPTLFTQYLSGLNERKHSKMRCANCCCITRYVNPQGLKTQLVIPQSLLKAHVVFGSVITSLLSGNGRKSFLGSLQNLTPAPFSWQRDFVSENCFWIRARSPGAIEATPQQSGGGVRS